MYASQFSGNCKSKESIKTRKWGKAWAEVVIYVIHCTRSEESRVHAFRLVDKSPIFNLIFSYMETYILL